VSIVVCGSIATDYLMTFPGRFAEQLIPDQLDHVSLSFLVDDLEIRKGGAAANIAFGLGRLGLRPVLVGAVGADFGDYRAWLGEHQVNTDHVLVSETRHTARFLCTTDTDRNQIASFYPGAMQEAREIDLLAILRRLSDALEPDSADLVVISPDDPVAMLQYTAACRDTGQPFAADPSQQLARMDGPEIRLLVDGAAYLFTNAYERELLESKTGWRSAEVLDRVGTWVTTHGPDGATVETAGGERIEVPAAPELRRADPTGVGDAFRAGYLAGATWKLDPRRSAQLGCQLAALVLESVGTQEYPFSPADFAGRLAAAYGPEAADEARRWLPGHPAGSRIS
jgi:adenosine kinase